MPRMAGGGELERLKGELKASLMGASDGQMAEALERLGGSPEPPEALAVKENGPRKLEAQAVKQKLCGAMMTAVQSGKLAEVLNTLDTMAPVAAVAAVPVRRLSEAELRENVRSKVQESIANGVLEQGLVALQRKKSAEPEPKKVPEDLKTLGQEICRSATPI